MCNFIKNLTNIQLPKLNSKECKRGLLILDFTLAIITTGAAIFLHHQGIDSQHPWTLKAIVGTSAFIMGITLPILLGKNHSKKLSEQQETPKPPFENILTIDEEETPSPSETPESLDPPQATTIVEDSTTSATAAVDTDALQNHHAIAVAAAAAATTSIKDPHLEGVRVGLVFRDNNVLKEYTIEMPCWEDVKQTLSYKVDIARPDSKNINIEIKQQNITANVPHQPTEILGDAEASDDIEILYNTKTSDKMFSDVTSDMCSTLRGINVSFLWDITIDNGQVKLVGKQTEGSTLTTEQQTILTNIIITHFKEVLSSRAIPRSLGYYKTFS